MDETYLKYIKEMLGINDVDISIIRTSKKAISPIKDYDIKALTKYDNENRKAVILIDSTLKSREVLPILCHECKHVKQYSSDRLKVNFDTNKFIFDDKSYGKKTKYEDRPWEMEAFKTQNKLTRLIKKKMKDEGTW